MANPSILLYLGPEEGDKRAAVGELVGRMRADHGDGLELHTFYAFETPADHVVGILRNGSLFGSGIVIRYRSVEHLKKKGDIQALTEYAAHPAPDTVLILESSEISVARELEKAAGSAGKKVFWEMFDNQKHGWLQGYFRRHNVRIAPEAIELMLELVQNNTLDLRQEADRLIAFVGSDITVEDVDRYIYHAREESIFTLYDALVAQDLDHALDILATLSVSTDAVQIVIGLSWQIERLYHVQRLRASGVADSAVFEELRRQGGATITSKRAQKSVLLAARAYSLPDCERIKTLTGEMDALLRTVPSVWHNGLLQQFLYAIIVRNGAWSPQGVIPSDTRWPWEYPGTGRVYERA